MKARSALRRFRWTALAIPAIGLAAWTLWGSSLLAQGTPVMGGCTGGALGAAHA